MTLYRQLFRGSPDVNEACDPSTKEHHTRRGSSIDTARAWCASHWVDAVLLAAIVSVAVAMGTMVFALRSPERVRLKQPMFGPVLMAAAGHGFVEPVVTWGSDMDRFLRGEVDTFDVDTLPKDPLIRDTVPPLASQTRYLLWCVTTVWRIFGISWTSVAVVAGALYALYAGFLYGLFRIIARPIPAALLTLFLVISPLQTTMLGAFRDFAKAPFIAGGIWALGVLLLGRHGAMRQLFWSAMLGVIIGVGIGFRQDLIVFVPLCVAMLPFISEDSFTKAWPLRIARTAVFCGAFALAGFPVLSGARTEGTNSFHVMIMGLTSRFGAQAGLTDASYSVGYVYKDHPTSSLIRNHAYRSALRDAERAGHGTDPASIPPIPQVGKAYDDASISFYLDYVTTFPRDFLMRGYAAVLRVLDFAPLSPHWKDQLLTLDMLDFESRWMEKRWRALGFLYGTGKYLFAAAVLLAGAIRVRYGLVLAGLVFYLAGITSLQFDTRHYFHLEFVFWWIVLLLARLLWIAAVRIVRHQDDERVTVKGVTPYAKRATMTAVVLATIVGLPLVVAWPVQSRNVDILARQWHGADLENIAVTIETQEHGKALIPGGQLVDESRASEAEMTWASRAEYIVLEFEGSGEVIPLDFEYSSDPAGLFDYNHRINVKLPETEIKQRLRLFVPIHFDRRCAPQGVAAWFKGISLPQWYLPNLINVARVADVTPFPFLFLAAVPEDLKNFRGGITIKGDNEPYYVRERRAFRRNLLPNGGFERWIEGGPSPIPEGFGMPDDSTLEPEGVMRFEGRYAARQVWSGSDAGHSEHQQFRIELPNRRPNASYELFARACNFTSSYIVIKATEIGTSPNGQKVKREVGYNFMGVPPVHTFQAIHGQFPTGPSGPWTLFISVHYYGDGKGESAVWDDFKFVEYEGPTL